MDRIKGELSASGQATGATRQLNIERNAGIPSFVGPSVQGATPATTAPSTQPVSASGKFIEYTKSLSKQKIEAKRKSELDPDESYDTQLQMQIGALNEQLLNKAMSPTDPKWRWLTPKQQMAIQSGDENAIKNASIGVKSIIDLRANKKIEDAALERQSQNDALTRFNTLSELGVLDRLSPEAQLALEGQLGLPTGSINEVINRPSESTFVLRSNGRNLLEIEQDASGRVINQRVVSTSPLVSSSSSTPEEADKDELSFDEFWSEAVSRGLELTGVSEMGGGFSRDVGNLYEDYKTSIAGTIINGVTLSDEEAFKLIDTENWRKMINQGLDPRNVQDIKIYTESGGSSSDDEKPKYPWEV